MAMKFDPGKYWVGQKQELNSLLSGRFRESGLSTGTIAGDQFAQGEDAEDFYLKPADSYRSRYDYYRVIAYRINKLLYLGDYYDVFRYMRYILDNDMLSDRSGGYWKNRKKLIVYIGVNILGLAARKLADLVSVETPEIKPWNGAPGQIQQAIDRIYENSKFPTLLYNSCLSSGVKGDAVWIIEAVRDNPLDLSEVPKVRIRRAMPEIWYPSLDGRDSFSFMDHTFAWEIKLPGTGDKESKKILRRQIYLNGAIIHLANWMNGDIIGDVLSPEELLDHTGEMLPENRLFTIAVDPLVVHIPNLQFDEQHPFGLSDFIDVKPMADELSHRMSQLASELDKHANLFMRGPSLGGKGMGESGRYISFQKDEAMPDYISLPVQAMDTMVKEVELLAKWILVLMEVAPGLVGLKDGAGVAKAEALRIEAANSVVKSVRKQLYLTCGIQEAFKSAMLLENEMGIAQYPVDGMVGVKWKDGLPDSPTEKAQLTQIRTGGKPTQSVEDAVDYLDGDAADETLKRLEAENETSGRIIDMTIPDTINPNGGEGPPSDELEVI